MIETLLAAVEARGPILVDAGKELIACAAAYRGGLITEEAFVAQVAAIHSALQLSQVGEC